MRNMAPSRVHPGATQPAAEGFPRGRIVGFLSQEAEHGKSRVRQIVEAVRDVATMTAHLDERRLAVRNRRTYVSSETEVRVLAHVEAHAGTIGPPLRELQAGNRAGTEQQRLDVRRKLGERDKG